MKLKLEQVMGMNLFAGLCLLGGRAVSAGRKTLLAGLILMVATSFGAGAAWGQAQNTGSIFGSVVDSSGAIVPGAQITVSDKDKGTSRTVKASSSGEYNIASLPVGSYKLTVTAPTFQSFVTDGIPVDADKSVKIVAKLTAGNASETITVEADGTALDTKSATLGTLIDNKLVEELPIDGRNVVALAGLLPGVTDLNAPTTNTSDRGGPTFSVSGSRNTQNLMLFDGLMWNNLFFNTGINYPPPSALQEISVLLNNFKAQYGRNAGSVFNVVTKSGTNAIHGSVWEYFQNRALNAADYITKVNPKDNHNQFGFSVQGPIKRDKAYFAGTFQDLIERLQVIGNGSYVGYYERGFTPQGAKLACSSPGPFVGQQCANFYNEIIGFNNNVVTFGKLLNPETISSTSGNQATPSDTENMLNSAWAQAGHTGVNPCIGQLQQASAYAATHPYLDGKIEAAYLPNAEVPVTCLNPVIQSFLNTYVPLPNTTAPANVPGGLTPSVQSVSAQPRNDKNVLGRVDWMATSRHTLDARYNLIFATDSTAPGVTSASAGIATYGLQASKAISNFGNIGDTWVLSPNLVNVLRVGYKRYVLNTPPLDNHTWADFGGNFSEPGTPTLPAIGVSGFPTVGSVNQGNSHVVNENVEMLEQISWTRGNHNYQFGANFLRLQYLNRQDYPGLLSFSSTFTGSSIADESLGLLNSVQANSPLIQGGINHSIFGYAQDDWRATSRLTLNLGIRYELPFQWYQPNGYSSTFIPGHQSTVFPGAIAGLAYPGDKGVLPSLVPTDFNGLVPRFGLAYDVFGDGKFAIRAGFGMFFDAINANVVGEGEPFYYRFFHTLPPGGASAPLATYGSNPADTRPNGNVAVVPDHYDKNNPQFVAPYSLFYPDRNFRTPYYEAFNAGFQYHLLRSGVLDVNYVGKLGRKLTIPFDQNPAITDCTGGYYQANPALYGSPSCPYLAGTPAGAASSNTVSTKARLRYTPFNYGGNGLVDFASIGTSNYNGLQVQYTQRGGKLLTIISSYTYSKAIDLMTQSQTTSNTIPNVFDVSSERGPSDYDARHVLNMGWVMNLPRVRTGSAFSRAVLNNWIYSGKFSAHSGRPYNVTINNDSALTGEPNQRAAIIPGRSPYLPSNRHRTDKIRQYFNVNAFTYPVVGTFSNVSRNTFVGPGYLLTDMTVARSIPLNSLREGMRATFRVEAFNVFNTPNLANPRASFSCSSTSIQQPGNANFGLGCSDLLSANNPVGTLSQTFGTIQSTFGNNANTSTNGRKMQLSLTVYF